MFWINTVFAVVFALLLTGVVIWIAGWRHPAAGEGVGISVLFVFTLLVATMLGVGSLLPERGPVFHGTPWLTLLLIGVFVSMLIMAVSAPPKKEQTPTQAAAQVRERVLERTVFGVFFWLLIVGLLVLAIVGYFV